MAATRTRPSAVLFDFDGVLGDTMKDNLLAWQKAMATVGVAMDANEYYLREGMKLVDVARELCEIGKIPLEGISFEAIVQEKEKHYLRDNSFSFYPGVVELIDALVSNGVPFGLVTAARPDRLAASVPADFLKKFSVLVTGDLTKKGKPDPEPYLLGAQLLGVPIAECTVVENAPLGIHSAKTAGAYCIAICSTLSAGHLKEADEVVPTFKDLVIL
jgi:beta-phosphoglucomutase